MGWSGAILVTATVLVIAGVSAAGGFWLAVSAGRTRARSRGSFLVGVVCGFAAGLALTARRRGLRAAVGALARALPAAAGVTRRKPVARRPVRFAAVPYLRAAWNWTGPT